MAGTLLFGLLPEEREALDIFGFAQSLVDRGVDVERRFSLVALHNAAELALRACLLKAESDRSAVYRIRGMNALLNECAARGLVVTESNQRLLLGMNQIRNDLYHGNIVSVPTKRDLEAWSWLVATFITEITGIDPVTYYKAAGYDRASLLPEDLEYVSALEKKFKHTPPYIRKLTWWSDIQRDATEAGIKWDLYVHYRPRAPYFVPTLVLVKCNPHGLPLDGAHLVDVEAKAALLKTNKRVWRTWLGIISSLGFQDDAIGRAMDYEGRAIGMVLIDPKARGGIIHHAAGNVERR